MALGLSAQVAVNIAATLTSSQDVGGATYPVTYGPSNRFTDGTGANQAKEMWIDTRILAASATENLDLAGVLADVFGNVLTFTKIKAILVTADPTNTNDVLVGGHATAAFATCFGDVTDVVKVKPGGIFLITAPDVNGLAVTATTGDLIKVTNSAGTTSITYTIAIIGVA